MTTHVTHVTVSNAPPPMQPQVIGAIYAIPGPEFKTYVPDYAPNRDTLLDEDDEDSEVETKVVTSRKRPARPKTATTAETKTRGRPRRSRSTDVEGAKEE